MPNLHLLYGLCRWTLGSIFLYAGSTKLLDPESFAVLIGAYGILPEALWMPAALTLSLMEVFGGVGLIRDIRGSLTVVTGLLVLFIAILGYGIFMGLDVDCGCFGPDDPEAKAFHGLRSSLYRDVLMLAGAAFMYGWRKVRGVQPKTIKGICHEYIKQRRSKNECDKVDGPNGVGDPNRTGTGGHIGGQEQI
jgi:uncharacterized membrane protein